ncbi:unnamed protein product [Boreogadus saida]
MVVGCLALTVQPYDLRKGFVLFGNFFEKGPSCLQSCFPVNRGRTIHSSPDDESNYQVDSAENRGPLPLSEIPPTCRYSMQRNALGLVMVAPYDGCNIIKEGGCYVLPMRWQGMPMMLVCPQPTPTAVIATPTTTAPAATTPTTPSATQTTPKPAALPFQFYQWNPLLMPPFNNNPNGQPVVYPPLYRNP